MEPSNYTALTDEELWKEYVGGADAAFTEIKRRYEEPIWRYLLLSGQSPRSAAQALGLILSHISVHREGLSGFQSLKEWIFAVTTQQVVPAHVSQQSGLMDFVEQLKMREPTCDTELLRRELADMQAGVRQPLLLVAVFGLSIEEAARACRFRPKKIARRVEVGYRRLHRTGLCTQD